VTIGSRCQTIDIRQPEHSLAMQWLEAESGKSSAEAGLALEAAGSSPLRALSYLSAPDSDAFGNIRTALANLSARPASVSIINSQFADIPPDELWRWLSLCMADASRHLMAGKTPAWLPADGRYNIRDILELQRKADHNRKLSTTPIRGDLLLQDWLIRWAEQLV
jgi:hypothetical protein